jgi:apolipoprotein N-acyltransferase
MPTDVLDTVHDALTSYISRIVALATPILAGALGAGLYWLQNAIGIDLQVDPAVAATFIGTIVLGAVLAGLKWLEGRAGFEKAATELLVLHEVGKAAANETALKPPPIQ